ncbi:PH domain-containing protein [Pigmentiphaga aceris]|uniref:PH domain-containing protein n=1 Tax=Pigmentiphaga aceris TaxID=1940612 RepID=A0A5C0AZL5_9BURK|nr:PH domain-containing protein [Pigmentiphaga aceris]QEI06300.1 PH domain-containing protein [Pigmentiphaga aceris]
MTHAYPSRIDAWLVLVIGGTIGLVVTHGVLLLRTAPLAALISLGVAIFTGAIVAVMTMPCRYELEENHLLIRCGMIRQRIAYADITGIAPSRSLLSAPALSIRRVKINFRHGTQLVSPREREAFIVDLQQRVDAVRA